VARALVGSEGTLVTVLHAELDLVPVPPCESLLVLGYDDICRAADDVPRLLEHCSPGQLEAVDGRMAQLMREEHAYLDSLRTLPEGDSWLLVQFTGDSQEDVDGQAHALLRDIGRSEKDAGVAFSDDPAREQKMLKAREAGLGVTARPPDDRETWEGWEDSAVPPERLGDYLRDLKGLFEESGYDHASLYGHFGQGCVHIRIPFGMRTAQGVADFRRSLERAADLVASYGGSLSGEHGDGQARGELLTRMFGERLVGAFGELKTLFDPANRMNPGKVVNPHPVDGQLRLGASWRPAAHDTHFGYPEDDHSFTRAVLRCVGIGNCRSRQGGVMCPSYRATKEEEHSTRGRARLLFEMLHGHPDSAVEDGWRSTWVRSRLPHPPQPVPPIYQPEVAARGVLHAADRPRRKQRYIGASTAATILANRLAPAVLDRYLARTVFDSQQTDGPRPAGPDNLFTPADNPPATDHGAHGSFDDRAHPHSWQAALARHPVLASATATAVGAAAIGIRHRVRGHA